MLRGLVLLVAVSGLAAQAQELDWLQPVTKRSEVEVAPAVTAVPDAGPQVEEPLPALGGCVASELPEWVAASARKKAALLTLCPGRAGAVVVDSTAEGFQHSTVPESTEVEVTEPLPGCATANDCATGFICSGYRSRWLRGGCEPVRRTSCVTAGDCAQGLACTGPNGTCQKPTGLLAKRTSKADPRPLLRDWGSPADEPDRFVFRGTVPEGFHLVIEPDWSRTSRGRSLVGAGIGTLTAGYLVSAGLSFFTRRYGGLVPVAGPIVILSEMWQSLSGVRFTDGYFYKGLAVLGCVVDVAAQVTGIVMLMVGLFSPGRWLERDVAKPIVTFVPSAAGAPVGASLVGRF
jgi:hypothetical protein